MIRAATMSDLPRLYELVLQMHAGSKYAARAIGVDESTAKSILMDGVRRHGGDHNGATLLNVYPAEGQPEAFMLGILQRVYSIGNRLEAQDFWLYRGKASARAVSGLVDAYIKWADASPKVAEICLSWTDVIPEAAALGKLYDRKKFTKAGEIFKRASE